ADTARRRAEDAAARTVEEADDYAARRVHEADAHVERTLRQTRIDCERRVHEADEYSGRVRTEADEYARTSQTQADADAELTRRQADVEAEKLIQDAMDHRTVVLRELVRRRDLASAQIRSLMAGRDLVIEALGQVGALVAGVTEGLQEIGTTPADFVQLDPAVEGVAPEPNAVVAVTRPGKPAGRARNAGALPEAATIAAAAAG
ncbi:MAG TPA: hypothetical protein VKD67_07280, partial [Acidimicrobiales bacterium]|nr:hypothetical protein [Acidimicrobiales bacterium]